LAERKSSTLGENDAGRLAFRFFDSRLQHSKLFQNIIRLT
jgi:hypothetical protein